MKSFFGLENFSITLLIFGVLIALFYLPSNITFLDPVSKALGDFELTDVVFSKVRGPDYLSTDTNIVLVNTGRLDRQGIAAELKAVNAHNPAVVGVDVFFRNPKTPEGDSLLVEALGRTHNLVMVSKVLYDQDKGDSVQLSHPMFTRTGKTGFANMITDRTIDSQLDARTVRSFCPMEKLRGRQGVSEPAFATRIAQLYNHAAYTRLLNRGNDEEIINYRGNTSKFFALDFDQVLDTATDLEFLRGKIVLLGYMGDRLGAESVEDVFFTPMNPNYVGKTYPDMYGVVVHANIVSMILSARYITVMPFWLAVVVAVLLCHSVVVLFSYLYHHREHWYDIVKTSMQIVMGLLLLYGIVLIFEWFDYRMNLTYAVAAMAVCGTLHELYHNIRKRLSYRRQMKQTSG